MDDINYWMGQPLNEVPRDLLEKEFIKAYQELEVLRRSECDLRVKNLRLEVELIKERQRRRWL